MFFVPDYKHRWDAGCSMGIVLPLVSFEHCCQLLQKHCSTFFGGVFFQTVMYNMCCKQHSWIFCDSNI